MQTKFDIVSVVASLAERIITLTMSREVDDASISSDVIALSEKASRRVVPCTFDVSGSVIVMHLLEWPVPNSEYVLLVQKNVKSVIGESLPTSLQRNIVFASALTSEITVISPVMFEQLTAAKLEWRETGDTLCNKFYYEIATDTVFSNVVQSSVVEGVSTVTLGALPDGQYYCRIRTQDNLQYGRWSQVVSFLIKSNTASVPIDPVYIKELKMVNATPDNTTPSAYAFVFNALLAVDPLPAVSAYKKVGFNTMPIETTVAVSGKTLTISPVAPAVFENNSTYEFSILDLTAAGYECESPMIVVKTTAMSPLYADAESVYDLMQGWVVDANTMLRNINEASKYADYLAGTVNEIDSSNVKFEVTQFVKYRAAKTSLLALYMQRAANMGRSGTVGEVEFEEANDLPGLKELMDAIDAELKTWQDAVRGYKNEGRNKPVSAIKSQKSSSTVRQDTISGGADRRVW